jgi:transposase InsO family protein
VVDRLLRAHEALKGGIMTERHRGKGPWGDGGEAGPPASPEAPQGGAVGGGESPSPQSRRYTKRQRSRLVAAYRESGVSKTAFCRSKGLTISSLSRWLKASGGTVARRRHFSPEERRAAVEAFRQSGLTQDVFCKTYGMSTPSLRAWLKRYEAHGPQGLEPRPRPASADDPRRIPAPTRAAIVVAKQKHPEYGHRRLRDVLRRFFGLRVSPGSVAKTLREEGIEPLPQERRHPRRVPKPPRRFERARPGELWQSDITSYVLRRQHRRVYLVAFLDDHSRFIVSFGLHLHQKQDIVVEALLDGIARFGKPLEALTDQGRQYYAWRGKAAFQKLLDKEGIRHVVSRPHHPQTLGKVERFWKTVMEEFWDRAKPQDLADARERLSCFVAHYNFFRPHQGIGGLVPADRFFGAEHALRKTLEEKAGKDALKRALEQPPTQPVFLFGQIGDHQVSLHGERGRLVVQTSDGLRKQMDLDELGQPSRENTHGPAGAPDGASSDRGGAGPGDSDPAAREETEADGEEADPLPDPQALPGPGAGAVGTRDARRAAAGAPGLHGTPRVVAREDEPDGHLPAPPPPSASDLAAVPTGGGGYARRRPEAAEGPQGADHAPGRSGRGPEGLEEGERGAQAATRRGGAGDHGLEADACTSGGCGAVADDEEGDVDPAKKSRPAWPQISEEASDTGCETSGPKPEGGLTAEALPT